MIEITFSPVRMDRDLTVEAVGDVLVLDGVAYDLAGVGEGDCLPAAALAHDLVDGHITRTDGTIRVTVRRPHGDNADEADRFPAPLIGEATGGTSGAPGTVDWTLMQSATAQAAERLQAWRASATMSRTDFVLALVQAQILSTADGIAAARGEVPQSFEAVVAALPDPPQTEVRIRWSAMTQVDRLNSFVALIAGAAGVSDAALDAIFGWAP